MHLNRLRMFVTVVDKGSFSAAARALGVSQSAVSQQMRAMEDDLGTPLLVRGGTEMRPTEAGKLVYEQSRRILELWKDLLGKVKAMGEAPRVTLRIGSSTVPSTYVLGELMYRFRRRHPDAEVQVQVGDSATVWEWVQDETVDLGAAGALQDVPGIEHVPLAKDTIVLIAPCDHPWAGHTVSPTELQHVPFLWRSAGSGTRKAVEEAFAQWGLDPDRIPRAGELGSTEAVVSAVEAGLGLSFVSSRAVQPALALDRICTVDVTGPPIQRQFYLIYKTARIREPLLASFVQCATKNEADETT